MANELSRFHKTTSVTRSGEIMVNAGLFSRGAVIAAFEMLGGVKSFAVWADENKSEFYTKMFGKVIGREVEHRQVDALEDILDTLDGDFEEIPQDMAEEEHREAENKPRTAPEQDVAYDATEPVNSLRCRLAQAAEDYTYGEYDD